MPSMMSVLPSSKASFLPSSDRPAAAKRRLLRCVAGLERPQSGKIHLRGRAVFDAGERVFVVPNQRNIGMVFQSYAIWPHLTVFNNVAFPSESGGTTECQIDARQGRPGVGSGRSGRLRGTAGDSTERWATTARRAGAGTGEGAGLLAPGRAAQQSRYETTRAHAFGAKAAATGIGDHDSICHPRSDGRYFALGSDRGDERRTNSSARQTRRSL